MSIFLPDPIRCTSCGHVNEVETPRSVNASRSPHHRAAVLAGVFQAFACDSCAAPYCVEPGFFYIDLLRRQWIGVFPPSAESQWRRWEQATRLAMERGIGDSAPPIAQQWRDGMRTRTVFGVAALREKLVAWDAELDDRWLELAKLRLMRAPDPAGLDLDARLRLISANEVHLVLSNGERDYEVERGWLVEMAAAPMAWRELWDEMEAAVFVDVARLFMRGDG